MSDKRLDLGPAPLCLCSALVLGETLNWGSHMSSPLLPPQPMQDFYDSLPLFLAWFLLNLPKGNASMQHVCSDCCVFFVMYYFCWVNTRLTVFGPSLSPPPSPSAASITISAYLLLSFPLFSTAASTLSLSLSVHSCSCGFSLAPPPPGGAAAVEVGVLWLL